MIGESRRRRRKTCRGEARQPGVPEAFSWISSSLNTFYLRYCIILPLGVSSPLPNEGLFPWVGGWGVDSVAHQQGTLYTAYSFAYSLEVNRAINNKV